MKAIRYRKFNEYGICQGETMSERVYTVRGAMKHLESLGFFPIGSKKCKLHYAWTNGRGINAVIL